MLEQCNRHDQQCDHDDGDGGSQRPVVLIEERLPQNFTDHQVFRTANQLGNHKFTDCGYENQHGACDDACFRQGQGNGEKRFNRPCAQIRAEACFGYGVRALGSAVAEKFGIEVVHFDENNPA